MFIWENFFFLRRGTGGEVLLTRSFLLSDLCKSRQVKEGLRTNKKTLKTNKKIMKLKKKRKEKGWNSTSERSSPTMDGERERVVIRERDGWIDGWVNSTERSVVVVVLVGGASNGGEMFWWLWFSALKKNTKKTPENPIPRDFSTRVYFIMMLYTL